MGTLMDLLGGAADVLSLPQRMAWKGISAAAGRDYKGTADVLADVGGMDRNDILTKGLGFAGDMALDPLTYLGAGLGAKYAAQGAIEGTGALRGLLAGAGEAAGAAAPAAEEAANAARSGLTHFTTPEAAANILGEAGGAEGAGQLGGRGGIFALPSAAEENSPFVRGVLRAGIPPSKAQIPIPIPAEAAQAFQDVLPLGPFSGWKSLGGAKFTAPGSIDMATGAFNQTGSILKPWSNLYGKDLMLHAGMRAPDLFKTYPGPDNA